MLERVLGVDDAPGHRWGAGTMTCNETRGMTAGLGVQHIVDVALSPDGDVFRLVPGDRNIAHACEELAQRLGLGMGEFDEFEAVGAGRIVGGDFRGRRIMRKGPIFFPPEEIAFDMQSVAQNACKVLAFFMLREEIMHDP